MKKISKVLVLILSLIMVFSTMVACSKSGDKDTSSDSTGTGEQTQQEKRIKMTMFMGNSGLQAPDGIDVSNNKFLNIIEDYANVDLEVEVPLYTDYTTKLNLLLASSNLPDIVHAQSSTEAMKRAEEGAFIDLYDYWKNSPLVQKYIDETKMEIAKSQSDGGYYRIPMKYDNAYQGAGVIARFDLIAKYNNNQWPKTVEDWIEIARKLKADDPDAIPFSLRPAGRFRYYGGGVFPFLYGANELVRYDYEDQKAYAQVQLPEYKAALETLAQLYKEGLFDPEFATHDNAAWFAKKASNSVLAEVNGMDQTLPALHTTYRNSTEFPEQNDWEWLVAPPLETYPDVVKDLKYTEPFAGTPITGHGLFISSTCKNPDRAWKVIEGLACDELYERIFWGWEGETYTVENGERIPKTEVLSDINKHRWGVAYAIIFGFNNAQDVAEKGAEIALGSEYFNKVKNHILPVDEVARRNGINPTAYVVVSDEASRKVTEANDEAYAIATEFVMGRIDSAEYDARVAEWTKNYGFIYDEYTEYINKNKADLESKGVNFNR